jgi:uncharacterized delta-60 repeat protein
MKKTAIILCFFILSTIFGTFHKAIAGMDFPNIEVVTIQPDGKIIAIGDDISQYIDRINIEGTLDGSFNPGNGTDEDIYAIAIQSDGKIIIGGYFTSYNGTTRNGIARINTDGTLDTSLDPFIGTNNSIHDIAIQSDGKIIIGGYFTSYNGTTRNGIARINTDGTLDTGFDSGIGTGEDNGSVDAVEIQSDGKIIIGGDFDTYNGTARRGIARINTDGTLDASFNPGAGVSEYDGITTIAIQSDGKIIIGGDFTSYNDTTRNGIARINTDGTLDTSFNPGTGADCSINSFLISSVAIQSDGKILIGGYFDAYNSTNINSIARLNSDGSLDTSFNPGTGIAYYEDDGLYDSEIETIAIQSDGKIIIGGGFDTYNGIAKNNIARINADGTLDIYFKYNNSPASPVFRFFNKIKGNHFYTKNITEKNNIVSTLSNEWNYEGIAYDAYNEASANITALYRFWNKKTGFHFYTQDEGEKNNIIATLSDTWNYEDVAYYTYSSEQPGTTAVYRFFNKIQGNHFYTTSITERNDIINNLSNTWNYENVAWYVPVD